MKVPFSPFLQAPSLSAQKEEESVDLILSITCHCEKVCWIVEDDEKLLWMYDRLEEAHGRLMLTSVEW